MIPAVLAPELRAGQLDIPATEHRCDDVAAVVVAKCVSRLRNSGAAVLLLPLG